MSPLKALGIVVAMSCLAGCSAIHDWEQQSRFGVTAADINPALISDAVILNPSSYPPGNTNAVTPDTNKNYLGLVIKDSEEKCGEFVSGLVLAETTENTGLDMYKYCLLRSGDRFYASQYDPRPNRRRYDLRRMEDRNRLRHLL